MFPLASILICGSDIRLLETRGWVLEHAGFRVWKSSNIAETINKIANDPIDLVILCQTLSRYERENILANIRSVRPEVKILVLESILSECTIQEPDAILRVFATPVALIAAVSDLTSASPGSAPAR